ncbi:hypothetical protein AAVH_23244 [Aphelenchoides avenae]|nr:hypothetical protein AAVH_23244 [Aphelenchus avenae]
MQVDVSKAAWHEDGYYSEKLLLLARDSFLDSLKFCYFQIFADVFPATAFFLKHPGYPNYVLSCVDNCQAADGIDRFIEKLESVLIMWHDPRDQQLPAPKQLSKSTKIDMPLLEDDMTAWITPGVHQVSQCEMQVFVNAKQWKQMKAYMWSVEYNVGCSGLTTHILQFRVENV